MRNMQRSGGFSTFDGGCYAWPKREVFTDWARFFDKHLVH
jgi:hypothetical protein